MLRALKEKRNNGREKIKRNIKSIKKSISYAQRASCKNRQDVKITKEKEMSKLSKAQRKIARAAMPFNKITGADFKILRMTKKKKNANSKI